MKKKFKVAFLMVCIFCFAGCAPHYYYFELTGTSMLDNEDEFKVIKNVLYARHLPGNIVDIVQNIQLANPNDQRITLNEYSFAVTSSVFAYELLNINHNTGGIDNPGAGIVLYNKDEMQKPLPFFVKAKDTADVTIIYKLKEEISEKNFKNKRNGEKLTLTLNFKNQKYTYKLKAKNQ